MLENEAPRIQTFDAVVLGLGTVDSLQRGFHHHATLGIAAYGYLVAERNRFSPSARAGRRIRPERHNPHSIWKDLFVF